MEVGTRDVARQAVARLPQMPDGDGERSGQNLGRVTYRVDIQRVYDALPVSGQAVLVDRVWPRGIKKAQLGADTWLREIGPSDALRAWFGHRPERWDEFRRHYRAELTRPEQQQLVEQLVELARKGPLTLLYGARDTERNQAVVIRELIEEQLHS
ncbi:MAG TPA: DUF488 family protein [Candidatus Dormibacteraeota bacterium]|nr:DUF488 family protein [Candidatus Dormibacteraeota bacterium]